MGSSASTLVDAEKSSWVVPHRLNYDESLRKHQLQLLANFGPDLLLCCNNQTIFSYPYQHWWITDGTWILEFGGGDILNNSIIVHCNPRTKYLIDARFPRTDEVMERMRSVCGGTNYSLALRNCEHVARYIHCGAWICFQMVGKGVLKGYFFDYMSTFTTIINTFPEELRPKKIAEVPLYPGAPTNTIRFSKHKDVLTESDQRAYNIVFLGPTGSGKSHLINNVFNLTVCQTAASVHSVTKQVKFYHGSYSWPYYTVDSEGKYKEGGEYAKPVNIIDTLGFCDSVMSSSDVLEAIKASVKVNLAYIDKVVIVCSGRIEKQHADSIKQFTNWLSFYKYRSKFVFVFNKADHYSVQDKMKNLVDMCDIFEADTNQTNQWLVGGDEFETIKMNLTTGFPPGASFDDIKSDHTNFTRALLCVGANRKKRIPVDKTHCTIL